MEKNMDTQKANTESTRSIGLNVETPTTPCQDQKCPFHGTIRPKLEFLTGTIIKKDTHNSATMRWERLFNVPKYERFEKRISKIHVHNPPCINAQIGDVVMAARTRPLSKTKHFVIVKRTVHNNTELKEINKEVEL